MFQDFYAQSRHLIWPLIGLVIFVGSFVLVLLHVGLGMRDKGRIGRLARLPLEGDDVDRISRPEENLQALEDKRS